MDAGKVADLKTFISGVEAKPELLELPQLAFFKKYLLSLGAKLPEPKKAEHAHDHGHSHAGKAHEHGDGCGDGCGHDHGNADAHDHGHNDHGHDHGHEESEEEEEPEEPEEPEEADPDLMTADNDTPAANGPDEAKPSDAQMEEASEAKMAAAEAASNGDFKAAIDKYTVALKLMCLPPPEHPRPPHRRRRPPRRRRRAFRRGAELCTGAAQPQRASPGAAPRPTHPGPRSNPPASIAVA